MFPHSDTVYAVHNLRLQDELQFAARQRLAATVREAARNQPTHMAMTEGLAQLVKQVRVRLRWSLATPGALATNGEPGRAGAAGARLA